MQFVPNFNFKKSMTSLVFLCIGFIFVVPFVWMISTSLKFENQVFEKPFVFVHLNGLNIQNYHRILFESDFFVWMLNSAIVVAVSVVLRLIFASFAGYAFGFLRFKFSNAIFFMFLITLFVPYQLTLLPQFIAFRKMGILDTHFALILPNIFDTLTIFLMRQFFMSFPRELISAAYIDGSGLIRSFFKIALPLARTPLITVGLLSFFLIWDQYYQPLIFLKSKELFTIPLGLQSFQSQYGNAYAVQMALACLAIIPVITVFLVFQKQFIDNMISSGIKG